MINKKYCEMRSNFTADVKKMYIGEDDSVLWFVIMNNM